MRWMAALAFACVLVFAGCGGDDDSGALSDRDKAVTEAQDARDEAVAAGQDLTDGPCISESLPGLPDWVADVAHEPRTAVDDNPVNQCQRYRSGEAHHFVELQADGQVLRVE
jgi:hypothetical protein